MLNIVVLVSGGGTNLQAIMDKIADGTVTNTKIAAVISNNANAYALERAKAKDIPYQVESFIGRTGTDADKMHFAADGTVTALVSLPLRYMHSPSVLTIAYILILESKIYIIE